MNTFSLKEKGVLLEEMKKRLVKRNVRFQEEMLAQFLDNKINGVNHISLVGPKKTEIAVRVIREWVNCFIRLCS